MRMPMNSSSKLIALMCALTLIGTVGCSKKAMYRSEIKDADLIPLEYPQSAFRSGALGWGKPKGIPSSVRPAEQNFSPLLLEKIPKSDAAWFGTSKDYSQSLSAMASPGAAGRLLETLNIISGEAGASIDRSGIKFVDWGDMKEETIDFQRLSNSIVRGWYNMSGESMTFDALAVFRPDRSEYDERPWLVRRSITANGLQYEVSKSLGASLLAEANQPIYASGKGEVAFSITNSTFLTIDRPMVIGYDTAELISIDPPMPQLVMNISPEDMRTHKFTWRTRENGKKVTTEVDPYFLRTQEKRESAEENYNPEVVDEFVETVSTGSPIGITAFGEAKYPTRGVEWEILSEGSRFSNKELVRLNINLEQAGYLYVLTKDSNGQAALLYPKVPGQPLSIGQDKKLPSGMFSFPQDVIGEEGMTFDSSTGGNESFIIVATANRSPEIATSMAKFAAEANNKAGVTRGAPFSFLDLLRGVSGYSSTQTSNGNAVQMPVFMSASGATVVVLNFERVVE